MQFRILIGSVAMAMSVATLAACGSGGDDGTASGSDDSTGGSASTGGDAAMDAAKSLVDKATQTTDWDWPMPEESFDPGKGKIAIVSLGEAIPAQAAMSDFALEAIETMGWTADVFDGEVSMPTIGNYITQAVNEGYDGIIIQSVDVNAVQAPVEQALKAGIPIACVSCLSAGYEDQVHDAAPDWAEQGRQIAAYMMVQADGKAKILGFPDAAFPAVTTRMDAMAAYLEENCPDCEYSTTEFTVDQLGSPVPPSWSAAMSTNPEGALTDVVAPYGDASALFAKAAKQAGRSDFRINSMDLTTGDLPLFETGGYPLGATTVSPYEYESWAAVDQVARQVAGLEKWDSTGAPSPLVVEDNASEFAGATFAPEDYDYKAEFAKLWGQG